MISIWVNYNYVSELFIISLFSFKLFFIKMVNKYLLIKC